MLLLNSHAKLRLSHKIIYPGAPQNSGRNADGKNIRSNSTNYPRNRNSVFQKTDLTMAFRPKRISTSTETDIDFGRNETAFRPKRQRQVCFYPSWNAILLGHLGVRCKRILQKIPCLVKNTQDNNACRKKTSAEIRRFLRKPSY